MGILRHFRMISLLVISLTAFSCADRKAADGRFSTPTKTYAIWLDTALRADIPGNMECLTEASRILMGKEIKLKDAFIGRMLESASTFKKYSLANEKIKGSKAIVVIREPKSGHAIAVPLLLEKGEWKVDLVAMFEG